MKKCIKCKNIRNIEDFGFLKKSKDGYNDICKTCLNEKAKQFRRRQKQKLFKPYRKCVGKYSCGKIKPSSEFPTSRNKLCIECRNDYQKNHYLYNKDKRIAYLEKNKEHYVELMIVWRKNNPEYQKQWYQENKIEHSIKSKNRYIQNIENIKKRSKLHYQNNKDTISEKNKEWYYNNIDKKQSKAKIWRESNKEKIKSRRRIYNKERAKIDPYFKLKTVISNDIRTILKLNGFSKNGISLLSFVEWVPAELIQHIENLWTYFDNLTPNGQVWMTWKNHGKYNAKTWDDNDPTTWRWNLDHIVPQSFFKFTKEDNDDFVREQIRKCWALSNLRPLSAKQNILEGNRR